MTAYFYGKKSHSKKGTIKGVAEIAHDDFFYIVRSGDKVIKVPKKNIKMVVYSS